jgi:hypothetical protein
MAWMYERPYATARGTRESYRQWEEEEEPLRGSGRRALHWRHLQSHIKLGADADADALSPHRQLAERRRLDASTAAWRVAEQVRLDEGPDEKTRRKRFVEPKAQSASIAPYGIVKVHANDRPSKRVLIGPQDDLDWNYSPRSRTPPPSTKRIIPAPGAATTGNTVRVLDLEARAPVEEAVAPRGMKKIIPPDALLPNFVGATDAKVDRGLRCHYDVPNTLSFRM